MKCMIPCALLLVICLRLSQSSVVPNGREERIKVGSFNVKWFGNKKSLNQKVMKTLGRIINRYDVMLMMEIRDTKQTAMARLWQEVNKTRNYGLTISKPLGRYPDFYTEQYAFFYRRDKITLMDYYQYNDSARNEFEREPYAVLVKLSSLTTDPGIALIGSHIQPKNAVNETNDLLPVVNSISKLWDTNRIMIMGDLNADCRYMNEDELMESALKTDKRFTWLIPDHADTTVSNNTDCAYDRIIVSTDVAHSNASVFYYDHYFGLTWKDAWAVSDHYPVEVDVYVKSGSSRFQFSLMMYVSLFLYFQRVSFI